MKIRSTIFLSTHFLIFVCAELLAAASASADSAQFPINVWPKPRTFLWPSPQSATLLSASFTISTPSSSTPHLTAAVRRYLRLLHSEHHRPLISPNLTLSSSPPLLLLSLSITDLQSPLSHLVDESYTLHIPNGAVVASLKSETVWGAMRGLETFSQLSWGAPTRVASGVFITDSPIYPHRGLLLDTSRNFYPVEDLMRTIEAMSWNKLNVFHWHITDSHSFPLELESEPDLAGKGSYGEGFVYGKEDVRRVVEFGMEHGVRVLPEIDAPGECN